MLAVLSSTTLMWYCSVSCIVSTDKLLMYIFTVLLGTSNQMTCSDGAMLAVLSNTTLMRYCSVYRVSIHVLLFLMLFITVLLGTSNRMTCSDGAVLVVLSALQ